MQSRTQPTQPRNPASRPQRPYFGIFRLRPRSRPRASAARAAPPAAAQPARGGAAGEKECPTKAQPGHRLHVSSTNPPPAARVRLLRRRHDPAGSGPLRSRRSQTPAAAHNAPCPAVVAVAAGGQHSLRRRAGPETPRRGVVRGRLPTRAYG